MGAGAAAGAVRAEWIALEASDGVRIGAWLARPATPPRAALLVVQEIFGVNAHIRAVVEDFAARGIIALAPAFFDRLEAGVALDCDEAGLARGRALVAQLGFDAPLRDLRAAADWLTDESGLTPAVVGYCWGGALAYLASTRLGLAAISYYGRLVGEHLHERPQAPLQFHFGEHDALIPPAQVEHIAAALPSVPLYRYPAGHGFNRLGHADGDAACAALAWSRAEAFLAQHGLLAADSGGATPTLDPRLADECLLLHEGPAGWLLLRDEARWPWCLWVPRSSASEFHALPGQLQQHTLRVLNAVAAALAAQIGVGKINLASLGNVVSQLHWHIIGRDPADPAWPAPCLGLPRQPYAADELQRRADELRAALPRWLRSAPG